MQEIIPSVIKIGVKKSNTVRRDGILPFTERPSHNLQKKEEPANRDDEINASELFSLFTANIIKEKIIFTR
jgi:hypothetical protein